RAFTNPAEGWAGTRARVSGRESGVRMRFRGAVRSVGAKFSSRDLDCGYGGGVRRTRPVDGCRRRARGICLAGALAVAGEFALGLHLEKIRMKWLKWIGIILAVLLILP